MGSSSSSSSSCLLLILLPPPPSLLPPPRAVAGRQSRVEPLEGALRLAQQRPELLEGHDAVAVQVRLLQRVARDLQRVLVWAQALGHETHDFRHAHRAVAVRVDAREEFLACMVDMRLV